MPRNERFTSGYEPFLKLQFHVSGPLSILNPTRAYLKRIPSPVPQRHGDDTRQEGPAGADRQVASGYEYQWRSRDNRKGRHALLIREDMPRPHPPPTSSTRQVLRGVLRMFTSCPYWDISYLVAVLFTLGSVVWVINGFFAYLPLVQPTSEFPHELSTGAGVTAFLGATIFELGSVLLLLEAVNERREGCFGWAVEQIWAGEVGTSSGMRLMPDPEGCQHRHRRRKGDSSLRKSSEEGSADHEETDGEALPWCWFPTWHDLRTHYLHEIGFLASLVQFISATVFWISGFTALPNIVNKDEIGALFVLETQPKWWIPAPSVLGWHVGVWNLIGGVGFTLCGALGFSSTSSSKVAYQSSLATFWGSWAFLIGSTIQWYESLSKYSVEVKRVK
ncbi:MAG: hypothetical protein M1813_003279 [Trichoglossum hirsutum]|nr:MAG: hypothetical protein M1813_003279 [Trichoglossum hirsutum]